MDQKLKIDILTAQRGSIKRFTDKEFPPTLDSICPESKRMGEFERFNEYDWIRA